MKKVSIFVDFKFILYLKYFLIYQKNKEIKKDVVLFF